jgi:5-methylcytosine-specific restriction endonuclease McrA
MLTPRGWLRRWWRRRQLPPESANWRTKRLAILIRDDYTCRYCKRRFENVAGPNGKSPLHVDHVVPKSRGGTDSYDNLVTACETCNLVKYTHTDGYIEASRA